MPPLVIQKEYGLSPIQQDALNIRMEVFVEEQHIPYELELDDLDTVTTHYVGYQGTLATVTARLQIKAEQNQGYIQRVATIRAARNQGYGKELINYILRDARKAGLASLSLNAQITALPFYLKSGFIEAGDWFLEADIPHKNMILKL